MVSVNVIAPPLTRMFDTSSVRDQLEDRYQAAHLAVYRLEPVAFAPVDGEPADPAARILAAVDLALPSIGWDAPETVNGITSDQRMITVVSFPVTGRSEVLTWMPTLRQLGTPPERFGLSRGRLAVVCEGYKLDAVTIGKARSRVRKHVEANLAHTTAEVDVWRADTARRIRDAVTRRKALIDALSA